MSALDPYILHAAIEADLDTEAQCYHERPVVEIDLGEDTPSCLEGLAARSGCEVDVVVNALVRAGMDAESRAGSSGVVQS